MPYYQKKECLPIPTVIHCMTWEPPMDSSLENFVPNMELCFKEYFQAFENCEDAIAVFIEQVAAELKVELTIQEANEITRQFERTRTAIFEFWFQTELDAAQDTRYKLMIGKIVREFDRYKQVVRNSSIFSNPPLPTVNYEEFEATFLPGHVYVPETTFPDLTKKLNGQLPKYTLGVDPPQERETDPDCRLWPTKDQLEAAFEGVAGFKKYMERQEKFKLQCVNPFVTLEQLLPEIRENDVVEVSRHVYSHFLIVLKYNEEKKYWSVLNPSMDGKVHYRQLHEVVGSSHCRINSNRPPELIHFYPDSSEKQIKNRADNIGNATVGYDVRNLNCEATVMWVKYGKAYSFQTTLIESDALADAMLKFYVEKPMAAFRLSS